MKTLLNSLFRFPPDPIATLDHVASILNLLDLPVGVMDRRFHTQILNAAARKFLALQGVTVGDRSKWSRYNAFRAIVKPCVSKALRSGRATFIPEVELPVAIEGGVRGVVCPGRIQNSDLAFVIAFSGCRQQDEEAVLQHIVERFTVGVLLVGPDLRFGIFNERALEAFRLKREDTIGKRISEINPSVQAKVLERQFSHMMLDHATRIEDAYPVASSKLGVLRAKLIAWPIWTSGGECKGLVILVQPLEAQVTAPHPDSKAMEMLGREGYAYGPPMFYTHVDGKISLMSAAARALLASEISDRPANFKTDLRWVRPEVIEGVYDDFVRGGGFSTVMADLETPAGLKPMRVVAHGIREVGDIVSQVFFVLSDASESENTRKMLADTVKSLATENEVLDRALDALDLPIALFDNDLRVLRINKAIGRRLEIDPRDAVGRDIADVIPTARQTGMATLLKTAIDEWKEIRVPRFEHIMRNGETMPMEGAVYPLRIEGRPCCMAVAREMGEVERLKTERAQWEGLARALMATTSDGVVVLDKDGRVSRINSVITERFRDKQDLVGRHVGDLLTVKEDGQLRDLLGKALSGSEVVRSGQIKLTRKDSGEEVFLEAAVTPLADWMGRHDGAACVVHFTTGLVRLEREVKQYTENLERLVRERTEEISTTNNLLAETVERITAVAESGMLLSSLRDPKVVFRAFLEQAKDILRAGFASLAVIEKQDGVPHTTYYSVGTPPAADIMSSGEIESGMAHLVLGRGTGEKVRTAGPRLLLADVDLGEAKGLLVASKAAGEFGKIEISLGGLLCAQIGFALPITRYVADLKGGRERAECLRRIAVGVAGASSPDEAMRCIARELAGVLRVARILWVVSGSDGHMWVSNIYDKTGAAGNGALRLNMSEELKIRHLRAVEGAQGRSFCEILEVPEHGQSEAERGDTPAGTCPFRVRRGGSEVGQRVASLLWDAEILPRGDGSLSVAPVMLSQGSWSLLCAVGEDRAALSPDDTCFICVAASTLAYVWKVADCASAVRRLQAASETVCDLVHDLKYPINKMRGDLEALEESCGLLGQCRDGVTTIKVDLENLKVLADELCEVSNPGNRKPEIVDVSQMVEHCLSLLSADLAAKAIEVRKDVSAVPPIFADRRDVTRVVLNILSNGVEAVAANGLIRIGATCSEIKPGVRSVSVIFEDSGPGVPESEAHRLFDAFFTTKKGGTGLGLFSARKRAQANGGDVVCEIVEGGKSRFVATFPAAVG